MRMVDRRPELEALLDVGAPAGSAGGAERAAVERLVAHAFDVTAPDDWRAAVGLSLELDRIADDADALGEAGHVERAATVLLTLIRGVTERYEDIWDNDSEVGSVVEDAVHRLGQWLPELGPGQFRSDVLRGLLDLLMWDAEHGGYGLAGPVPEVLGQASLAERAVLALLIRLRLEEIAGGEQGWARERYAELLLAWEGDEVGDAAYVELCRKAGRTAEAVRRLLAVGLVDDAVRELEAASAHQAPGVATVFVEAGEGPRAEDVLEARRSDDPSGSIHRWLRERAAGNGDEATRRSLTVELFRLRPSIEAWRELVEAAGDDPELLGRVRQGIDARRDAALLVEIALESDDVASLRAVAKTLAAMYRPPFDLVLQAARFLAADHPDEAADLVFGMAERAIGERSRDRTTYRRAAGALARAKRALIDAGRGEVWDPRIEAFRAAHRRLPALQDELNVAGL